ncbi:hypothetical protein VIBNISO65_890045 [Vibrio nigripulchritudo SO65]|nr:hypothetical protein VIBNIAM115_540017 [Vibrio nigripulchritudo AM115]CCN42383.1 hypothetical protein VIBNIFTn2_290045 [Vibrio nigripulchritudo FTn2]CCN67138.1 hypothetical protein VIBNIPon4_700045 [Vibrio nigripulchritudo POn4]CCN79325.1 hypothetical protein VIBNISO65_890045 [Vibrio nigripulchritudo SO65]
MRLGIRTNDRFPLRTSHSFATAPPPMLDLLSTFTTFHIQYRFEPINFNKY